MKAKVLTRAEYERELRRLQVELVRRIAERTNPRVVRTVALGMPSDRERSQCWKLGPVAREPRVRWVSHLLDQIPYEKVDHDPVGPPPRQERAYVRPPADTQTFVPERCRVE